MEMNQPSSDESDLDEFYIPESTIDCEENGEQYDVPDNELGT